AGELRRLAAAERCEPSRAHPDFARAGVLHLAPERPDHAPDDLHIADPRDVAQDALLIGEQGRDHVLGQRVLRSPDAYLAPQRAAAADPQRAFAFAVIQDLGGDVEADRAHELCALCALSWRWVPASTAPDPVLPPCHLLT